MLSVIRNLVQPARPAAAASVSYLFLTIPVRPIVSKSTGTRLRQIFRDGKIMAVDDQS